MMDTVCVPVIVGSVNGYGGIYLAPAVVRTILCSATLHDHGTHFHGEGCQDMRECTEQERILKAEVLMACCCRVGEFVSKPTMKRG